MAKFDVTIGPIGGELNMKTKKKGKPSCSHEHAEIIFSHDPDYEYKCCRRTCSCGLNESDYWPLSEEWQKEREKRECKMCGINHLHLEKECIKFLARELKLAKSEINELKSRLDSAIINI